GPEDQLRLTEITQPAILATSVAAWRVVNERGLKADYVAGHSLGEYSAHGAQSRKIYAGSGAGRCWIHGCDSGNGLREGRSGLPGRRRERSLRTSQFQFS